MEFDLVVRNGTVIDGSGAPAFRSDVGVLDGQIASIGRIREKGREELDAEGQFVTPGFVEGHTHLDAQINWDPLGTSSCWHGVTTAVMGNCGLTLAPCRPGKEDLVLRALEGVEQIPREAMLAGIDFKWETFAQYLDALAELPKGLNISVYLGHSSLRSYVMGDRAYEDQATDDELEQMKRELAAGLRAGAIGFTSQRGVGARTGDGRAIPSQIGNWEELRKLVNVMGDLGAGHFELSQEKHEAGAGRDEYNARLKALAIECGRPIFHTMVITQKEPDLWRERLANIDAAAEEGARIVPQLNTHESFFLMSFEVGVPFDDQLEWERSRDDLPSWSKFRKLPLEEQKVKLKDPAVRDELVKEANEMTYRPVSGEARLVKRWQPIDFDEIVILDSPTGPYRSVASVAAEQKSTPVEVMIDLALATDFKQFFGRKIANYDQESVLGMMQHPRTVLGASDAGAHVLRLSNASWTTQFLAHWVRERESFTWEEGIRMLTSIPARAYGFADRGLLREGFAADLVVLNPRSVAPKLPNVEHDFPTGQPRITQEATGISATVVNGQTLLKDGQPTGALPGRLLRGPLAKRS